MRDAISQTRLRWNSSSRSGIAKLHGRCVALDRPPTLAGAPAMVEVDYVPELGVYRVRDRNEGWRDMNPIEVKAADTFLRQVINNEQI